MPKLMTFHKVLPGCQEGNPEAWRVFIADYTPLALGLFEIYSSWTPEVCLDNWRGALGSLRADDCAMLKGFPHQSEREFLVGLRAFLLDRVATRLDPAQDAVSPPAPTFEHLGTLLHGLPLLHQEIAFLTLAGHSLGTLEKVFRLTPGVAAEGLARLRPSYGPLLEPRKDRCLWPSAWIAICQAAGRAEQKDCIPLRQLIRILDGQASWYDKTPAEEHRSKCLHCLQDWVALLEVGAWERARQPLPQETVDLLLASAGVRADKPKRSFLARIMGR
jgi:hypothetical protein